MILQDTKRFDDACAAYDAAISLKPGYGEAYKRRATLRLLQGDYREGWEDYEASLQRALSRNAGSRQTIPYWFGQPLRGKSIVLCEPNGLGDTIQFFRYLPAIVAMGADVSFLGPERMFHPLGTCSQQARFLPTLGTADTFDYRCELWSLPHIFRSELDSLSGKIPYLAAEPEAIAKGSALLSPEHS